MTTFAEILGLGVPELVVILVIVLLIFGGKKLPELARSIGTSVKELRQGVASEAKPEAKSSDKA